MHGHVAHGYLNYMIASSYNLAGMFEWGAKCSRKGQNISCETFFMSNLILGEMLHAQAPHMSLGGPGPKTAVCRLLAPAFSVYGLM